ncbi:hypothetical protein ACHAWO_000540 [Cyclotella atomus]|uniref:Aldehyde dehydrogenase domain-containing protein n=1 Tax=Cyclotella atomus TaxID=382360 RepID=A0ABD3P2J5_9STRA
MTKLLRSLLQSKHRCHSSTSPLFTLINPANATPHSHYHAPTPDDLSHALELSSASQKQWSKSSPTQRSTILRRAADILSQNVQHVSRLETMDTGRPIRETEFDVLEGIECLHYYSGQILQSHDLLYNHPTGQAYVKRVPMGTTCGIGAWNYPFQGVLWKGVASVVYGNSMMYKPSEFTPSTALWMEECLVEAGLPEGVFQVVLGGGETAQHLIHSPKISKVSFTGSVSTGLRVYQQAAASMKKVTMELGGKSPLIIFNDAHLDNAVCGAMMANWYSSGQVCSNGTRVFVQEDVMDEFVQRLLERTKKLRIGDPMDTETDIGPMVHKLQYDKVLDYIHIGMKEDRATLLYGGKRPNNLPSHIQNGYNLQPAIFTNCTDEMTIAKEEIFGMVMSILSFKSEQEVIERANNTEFGLAAGVFTQDIQRGQRVIDSLDAGAAWINNYNLAPIYLPWGGCKLSGIGRENGVASVEEWTQWKSVYCEMGDVDCPYPK